MQISIILLGKLINFFIMILLGFILVNKNILKSSDSRILSIIVVYLVMPCAIIGSFEIDFTKEKETVIYLGTLMVTGTDQKIRFGGVPFLRPGFEYKVEILDEKDEAIGKFKARYPSFQRDIQVKLMEALRIHAF